MESVGRTYFGHQILVEIERKEVQGPVSGLLYSLDYTTN